VTPSDLRAICNSLNDEHGTSGQSKLARLLGWNHSTVVIPPRGISPGREQANNWCTFAALFICLLYPFANLAATKSHI
jgi:hypothetical protein